MKRQVKILIAVIATPIVLFIVFLSAYILINIQGVIQPFEQGNPEAVKKVLIASQGSEFKIKMVDTLINYLEDDDTYSKIIDCTDLEKEDLAEWSACILIHTMQIHREPKELRNFLLRASDLSKIISIRTSGGGDETRNDFNIDAISSPSRLTAIAKIMDWTIPKLELLLNARYPGNTIAREIPEIFAPGIVSTQYAEFGITISPNLSEIYFTRRGEGSNPRLGIIMFVKMVEGEWTEPEIAPFSGTYNDMEPLITPDGKKLLFGSNRPLKKGDPPQQFLQWYVERTGNGWTEPKILGTPFINRFVMYPTIANNRNLYFTAQDGIYKSLFVNGVYQEPVKLGKEINGLKRAAHSYISPDESYIIFDAQMRGDLKSDLYISYQKKGGDWTEAQLLGKEINADESQAIALISPDKKILFFIRNGEVYWVRTNSIPELNLKYIKDQRQL